MSVPDHAWPGSGPPSLIWFQDFHTLPANRHISVYSHSPKTHASISPRQCCVTWEYWSSVCGIIQEKGKLAKTVIPLTLCTEVIISGVSSENAKFFMARQRRLILFPFDQKNTRLAFGLNLVFTIVICEWLNVVSTQFTFCGTDQLNRWRKGRKTESIHYRRRNSPTEREVQGIGPQGGSPKVNSISCQ